MPHFPQLLSGALAQYPIRKRRGERAVVNWHLDGSRRLLLDANEASVSWVLSFQGLNLQERGALESFFELMEGRLGEFTFVDPTDNLLLWSEQLSNAAWSKDPMVQVTEGVADPFGTNRATRLTNSGAATQNIEQVTDGPSGFCYSLSVFTRSTQPASVTLYRATASQSESGQFSIGPQWRRYQHAGGFGGAGEGVRFGVQLAPGASVEVCGFQAESQPLPSAYRRTTSRSGVYSKARFEHDTLTMVADGPDRHACLVRVGASLVG